jgi:hypothetical protein
VLRLRERLTSIVERPGFPLLPNEYVLDDAGKIESLLLHSQVMP